MIINLVWMSVKISSPETLPARQLHASVNTFASFGSARENDVPNAATVYADNDNTAATRAGDIAKLTATACVGSEPHSKDIAQLRAFADLKKLSFSATTVNPVVWLMSRPVLVTRLPVFNIYSIFLPKSGSLLAKVLM